MNQEYEGKRGDQVTAPQPRQAAQQSACATAYAPGQLPPDGPRAPQSCGQPQPGSNQYAQGAVPPVYAQNPAQAGSVPPPYPAGHAAPPPRFVPSANGAMPYPPYPAGGATVPPPYACPVPPVCAYPPVQKPATKPLTAVGELLCLAFGILSFFGLFSIPMVVLAGLIFGIVGIVLLFVTRKREERLTACGVAALLIAVIASGLSVFQLIAYLVH